VEVESESHDNVTEIESKQLKETNSMVEEFMLLSNITVAEKLFHDFPELALLRRHTKPSQANFEDLIKGAKSRGYDMDVSSGKGLSESLEVASDPKNDYFNLMLRMITTRCMTQAQYFCSGALGEDEAGFNHFGLAAPIYTHFTSPIRRYADLIVHRLLSHSVGASSLDSTLVSRDKMQAICDNINRRHRNAQQANRASVKLHTLLFIKNAKRVIQEKGYILYVRKNALVVFIPKLALEVMYFTEESAWTYDPIEGNQRHIESKVTLRQFDPVEVRLGIEDRKKGYSQVQTLLIQPPIDCPQDSEEPSKKQKV
jgi:exosome complex exonuclease DIS3/RRP44